jgi:hypothetical protein|tara:strand:+ start:494 stop:1279 length:786 start_codon:yes stop_codon:yes gene_type:complete
MSTLKSSAEDLTLNADGSGNDIKFQSNAVEKGSLTDGGVWIGSTFEPTGDTAASDNAAIGYTAAEGLILTGQGSTDDVTIKNDADTTVLNVATGSSDIEVSAGDLIFGTAGKGICLGATSNTDANTLDDYEEGTWTPVYTASGGSAGGSFSNSEAEGHYTKIGRLVNCKFKYTLTNNGDWTGNVILTGLPFACDGDSPHVGGVTLNNCNFTGSWGSMRISNGASTTSIIMTNDNASVADLQASMVDDDAAIRGSFQYHTTS